jgi:hypothetical protein
MAMKVSLVPSHRLSPLRALAVGIVALAFMLTTAGAAHAVQHQFCYGANVTPGNACASGYWYMNAAYADSSQGPVCLYMSGGNTLYGCEKKATEGIYLNIGCYCYGNASIWNWNGSTIKVYGLFFTQ